MTTNIKIDVTSGVITCSPKAGLVRAVQKSSVAWKCDEQFTLKFQVLGGDGTAVWPFVEAQPTWPVLAFQGTLQPLVGDPPSDQRPAYKYTVIVGGNKLDPIIIVDKN